ncbi:MAG: YdaU family protein [Alphaproteobacteria bacterium]|nr:YdaU family protein [Alphaproteobacteria bacterium]
MGKNPFFPFYPSDWLAGTRGLTAAETGVYITLVAMMYEAEGPIDRDMRRLARLCGSTPASFKKIVDGLVKAGKLTVDERGFFNPRVGVEIEKRSEKRASASASATARWEKEQQKQGQPNADAVKTQCVRNANQKPELKDTLEANASNDGRAVDFTKAIFEKGVRFLVLHGSKEPQARAIIGRWRKDYDDREIFGAIADCERSGVIDPVPWITARLRPRDDVSAIFARLREAGKI